MSFPLGKKALVTGLLSVAVFVVAVAAVTALAMPLAMAQMQKKHHSEPKYDRSTETTLKGVIVEVSTPECSMMAKKKGMHVTIKTGEQSFIVHLGPASMMEEYGFAPKPGENVEITGSRIQWEGKETLLARRVIAGDVTLTLRDEAGKPVWSHKH